MKTHLLSAVSSQTIYIIHYVSRPAIDFWPTDHKLDGLYASGARHYVKIQAAIFVIEVLALFS